MKNLPQSDSTFQHVYRDVKSAVTAMADALKVGSEHVYEVMVRQQLVNAVVWVLIILVSAVSSFFLIRFANKCSKGVVKTSDEDFDNFCGWAGVILALIAIGGFIFNINSIVMGFLNPEYGAIQDIIEFIKK